MPGTLSWRYDPTDPTPSIGGPICCTGRLDLPAGPLDQSANARRADVLGFATAPLPAPVTIAGDIRADIAVSSDAPDTDLVATVLDIGPDGRMVPVQEGALRLRYRDGYARPAPPLAPGEVVTATIRFPPIAYQVAAGHRIGLHMASGAFPRLERNLGTGGANWLATKARVATNIVHLGGDHGSVLVLPVRPQGAAARAD